MIGFLISLLVIGTIAGFLARALVPGRDPMGISNTILLGIIGSFLGGFLGALIHGRGLELTAAGLFGSIVGAVLALLIYRRMGRPSTR